MSAEFWCHIFGHKIDDNLEVGAMAPYVCTRCGKDLNYG